MWKKEIGGAAHALAVAAVVALVAGLGFYLSDKVYIRFPHAHVAPADFTRRYSADELKSDFRYLTATVEHIHPDVAAVTDKSQYAALKALTLASLDHPMTRTEFFRAIAPALGRAYADGHTELLTPTDEEWSGYAAHGGMAPRRSRCASRTAEILVDRSLGEPALAHEALNSSAERRAGGEACATGW